MRDYPLTRTGLRQAMEDGYASVITERGDRVVLLNLGAESNRQEEKFAFNLVS